MRGGAEDAVWRWARLTIVSRIAGAQMSRPRPHATTQRTAGALGVAEVGAAAVDAAAVESVRARLCSRRAAGIVADTAWLCQPPLPGSAVTGQPLKNALD